MGTLEQQPTSGAAMELRGRFPLQCLHLVERATQGHWKPTAIVRGGALRQSMPHAGSLKISLFILRKTNPKTLPLIIGHGAIFSRLLEELPRGLNMLCLTEASIRSDTLLNAAPSLDKVKEGQYNQPRTATYLSLVVSLLSAKSQANARCRQLTTALLQSTGRLKSECPMPTLSLWSTSKEQSYLEGDSSHTIRASSWRVQLPHRLYINSRKFQQAKTEFTSTLALLPFQQVLLELRAMGVLMEFPRKFRRSRRFLRPQPLANNNSMNSKLLPSINEALAMAHHSPRCSILSSRCWSKNS